MAIHGLRVIDSRKGVFVSMPTRSYTDSNGNTQYSEIAHAVTKETREAINTKVLEAYNQALQQSESNGFTEMDVRATVWVLRRVCKKVSDFVWTFKSTVYILLVERSAPIRCR